MYLSLRTAESLVNLPLALVDVSWAQALGLYIRALSIQVSLSYKPAPSCARV
jgi:hypothetical protein